MKIFLHHNNGSIRKKTNNNKVSLTHTHITQYSASVIVSFEFDFIFLY